MYLKKLIGSLIILGVMCPVVLAVNEDPYSKIIHKTIVKVPWKKIGDFQTWVGKWQGQNCRPITLLLDFGKPEAFTTYGLSSNAFNYPDRGQKFLDSTYDCGINQALDNNNQVLGSVSFRVSTKDGKLFQASPSKQVLKPLNAFKIAG